MIHLVVNSKCRELSWGEANSAAQLWREAGKARQLANAAFGERERQQLIDVAETLEHDAAQMEGPLALNAVNRT